MEVTVLTEAGLTVGRLHEAGMVVPEGTHADSVQLLALALCSCTWTTLATYGQRFDCAATDIVIDATWTLAESPKRVANINLDVHWPSLPESRLDAATRAAKHCTIHATLSHGCDVEAFVDH